MKHRIYGLMETASMVGVHVNTIQNWWRRGHIPKPFKAAGRWFFIREDIHRIIRFKAGHAQREKLRFRKLHEQNHQAALARHGER